tara:strand:- start:6626 stop:6805 length:180 start_codon:yes stop_codon:yes gene_type:complete
MGNSLSRKACIQCSRCIGDYGLDYMCRMSGKGKWDNKNICIECLYKKIKSNKEFDNLEK